MNGPKQTAKPNRLRVAAAQMNAADSIEGNLGSIDRAAREASRRRADVVLFPECALTGYTYDFSSLTSTSLRRALNHVSRTAAEFEINLLVGTPVFKRRGLYNCLVAFDRCGKPVHCYAKCQLTPEDQKVFRQGNAISLFGIDGVCVTTIICHERRYPELVRLACMAGAKIVFHPNAGMDSLAVSKGKRRGRDGIAVRAFENGVYYVFANSVGKQIGGKWSAGDSKIVSPSMKVLKSADNQSESIIVADLDLTLATRKYAVDSLKHPRFLSATWREVIGKIKRESRQSLKGWDLPAPPPPHGRS